MNHGDDADDDDDGCGYADNKYDDADYDYSITDDDEHVLKNNGDDADDNDDDDGDDGKDKVDNGASEGNAYANEKDDGVHDGDDDGENNGNAANAQ